MTAPSEETPLLLPPPVIHTTLRSFRSSNSSLSFDAGSANGAGAAVAVHGIKNGRPGGGAAGGDDASHFGPPRTTTTTAAPPPSWSRLDDLLRRRSSSSPAPPPLPAVHPGGHEKSVSLLLEDADDHVFRLVEPGDIDDDDGTHLQSHHSHHAPRPRSDSHGSGSVLETLYTDVIETFEDVTDTIADVLHEDLATPIKPRDAGEHAQKLSAVALAVVVFYKVSGGPFGAEPAVQAAGPFYALVGFAVFPLLWSIPEALVTAELGSAYPEPAGGTCVTLCVYICVAGVVLLMLFRAENLPPRISWVVVGFFCEID